MTSPPIPTPMPPQSMPLVGQDQRITQGWFQYFLNMYNRLGAQLGQIQATLVQYESGQQSTVTAPVGELAAIPSGELLGNISGAEASPIPVGLSAMLDNVIGTDEGALLVRGPSAWEPLTPGNAGQVLTSQGDGVVPDWEDSISTPISDGEILANISGGTAVAVGNTLSAVLDYVLASAQGSLIFRSATGWVALGPGTNGQVLETQGPGADLQWGTVTSGPSPANPTATASDTAVNGTATTYMRSDAAPAVQKGTSAQFGLVKVDGTSITSASGLISAVAGPATLFHPGYQTGQKYPPASILGTAASTVVAFTGTLYFMPFYVGKSTTFTKSWARTSATGANVEMGIYTNSNGVPGALITDFGQVASAANADVSITINQALAPGWYWLAVSVSATVTLNSIPASGSMAFLAGFNGALNAFPSGYQMNWTYSTGNLPAPSGLSLVSGATPMVCLSD